MFHSEMDCPLIRLLLTETRNKLYYYESEQQFIKKKNPGLGSILFYWMMCEEVCWILHEVLSQQLLKIIRKALTFEVYKRSS